MNLFEAASGYGAFVTDVTVNMDASKGGFNASDNWMNDIDGTGSLTKAGTGQWIRRKERRIYREWYLYH